MKRLTTVSVAAVFACAAATTAQTQTGQAPQGQTQRTETQRQDNTTSDQTGQRPGTAGTDTRGQAATTMFIGCVEKGSTPNSFALSITEVPGAGSGAGGSTTARGTSGTTSTMRGTTAEATAMVGHRMELIGGTDLAAHVGHKVEISGMVLPQGTATGRPAGQPAAMRMNVTNLRHIDPKCTAAASTRGTTGTATPGTAGTSGTSSPETSEPAPSDSPSPIAPEP